MTKRSSLSTSMRIEQAEPYQAPSRIKDTTRERGRTNVTWFVGLASHKRLKEMALEKDTTLQGIIDEAMNRWLAEQGEPALEDISKKGRANE